MAGILREERAKAITIANKFGNVVRQINSVPTMQYTNSRNATAKGLKAHAESRLAANINQARPGAMATAFHPLLVNSAIKIDRPLHWRGGMLSELWKMKGSQSTIINFRDTTKVDQDAKLYGGHNRRASMETIKTM